MLSVANCVLKATDTTETVSIAMAVDKDSVGSSLSSLSHLASHQMHGCGDDKTGNGHDEVAVPHMLALYYTIE